MLVAIYAFENQYGGLHGMNNHCIVEVEDEKAAVEWACEQSRQVMDSYNCIGESFESMAEDDGLERDTAEWDDYIEECIQDNIGYQIWEVVDCYADEHTMEEDFYNSRDEFVKEHCRELE